MNAQKKPYILRLLPYAAILAAFLVLWQQLELPLFASFTWKMFAIFLSLHYITTKITLIGIDRNPNDFVAFYFISMFIRMFCTILIAVIFLINGVEDRAAFVTNYFLFYLSFFVFEIKSVLTNLRPHSK